MKNNIDYKSRFRILKGGKISLVVSALVASVALTTPAYSDTITISGAETTIQTFDGTTDSLEITNSGSVDVTASNNPAQGVATTGDLSKDILNSGTIDVAPSSGRARGS